jgi:hypothetical protein
MSLSPGSGAQPASYPMSTEGSISGSEADHSPKTSAEVKNAWIYTSTFPYVFMGGTTLAFTLFSYLFSRESYIREFY